MFRLSNPHDFDQLSFLWEDAFHEPKESARFVFEKFCGYEHLYVLEENGVINAMLCAVPCSMEEKTGIYLYGVTTRRAQRGRGLTTALMAYAETAAADQGVDFSVLIPQTPDLFAFYERTGYQTAFFRRRFSFPCLPCTSEPVQEFAITPETILTLRNRFLTMPTVELKIKALKAVTEDLILQKARGFSGKDGYCICRSFKESAMIEELYAGSPKTAEALLSAACRATFVRRAEGYLPLYGARLFTEEQTCPFGMVKYFHDTKPAQSPYMALMLN